jgi:CheY-like chemotaxis protein
MKGDRERCLEAGMDTYVAKPIRPAELFEAIASLTGGEAATRVPVPPPTVVPLPGTRPALDEDHLLASVDHDPALLSEVAGLFLAEVPVRMNRLHESIAGGVPADVQKAAHALKGMLLAVGGSPAGEVALRLELMGRQADLRGASEAASELDAQIVRLEEAVRAMQVRRAA